MAVNLSTLQEDVLRFNLRPNESLNQFRYPLDFIEHCKEYLWRSSPYGNPLLPQRFQALNFDGFISYNFRKVQEGRNPEDYGVCATNEDVKNWQTAIKCLQRYCQNLLLAPKRRDFHQIKVRLVQHNKGGVACMQFIL